MIFEWPQMVLVMLGAIGIGVHVAKHGQTRTDTYHAPARILAFAIEFGILYAGGFFG